MNHAVSKIIFFFFVTLLPETHYFPANASAADSHDKIVDALEKIGLEQIQLDGCRLQYSKTLSHVCPSDKPISFSRTIDLGHISVRNDFVSGERETDSGKIDILIYRRVSPYAGDATLRFEEFGIFVSSKFPDSNWPRSFGVEQVEITKDFLAQFPDLEDFSFWRFETCHGPSYSIDSQIGFTSRSFEPLQELHEGLKEYIQAENCSKN